MHKTLYNTSDNVNVQWDDLNVNLLQPTLALTQTVAKKQVTLMDNSSDLATPGEVAKSVAAPVIGLVKKIQKFSIIERDNKKLTIVESPEESGR
jgi:hypothetical protein